VIDPATAYARRVVPTDGEESGELPASRLVIGAARRHLAELEMSADEDFPFYFDPAAGEKFEKFCRLVVHYKGEWAGKPFDLEAWQKFVFYSIFGWKRKADGLRRFRIAYVEVPRKNGKSAMLSAMSLYMLTVDGEPGAECYTLATKRDQAKIVYGDALRMMSEPLANHVLKRQYALLFPRLQSKLEPLSADAKTLDGLNPHFACADELHEWPDRALWDVVEDGMGSRRQPLLFGITTAGTNQQSFCYTLRNSAASVCLDAGKREFVLDSTFAFIAGGDPEDVANWRDVKVWQKANPSLGGAKKLDYLIGQRERVDAEPSKLPTFLIKQLDIWTNVATQWLDVEKWNAAGVPNLREILKGRRCWGGLDLAKVNDLSSFALVFPPEEPPMGIRMAEPADAFAAKWKVLVWHWCPADDIARRSRRDKVPYETWRAAGHMESTPGNVTDFAHVRARVADICADYQVEDIGFDRVFAGEVVQGLQDDGLRMIGFGQGYLSMAPPTSELERLTLAGELVHDGNPVTAWMASNVTIATDPAGNKKPDKRRSRERIDGIVAAIMALGRAQVALAQPVDDFECHAIG